MAQSLGLVTVIFRRQTCPTFIYGVIFTVFGGCVLIISIHAVVSSTFQCPGFTSLEQYCHRQYALGPDHLLKDVRLPLLEYAFQACIVLLFSGLFGNGKEHSHAKPLRNCHKYNIHFCRLAVRILLYSGMISYYALYHGVLNVSSEFSCHPHKNSTVVKCEGKKADLKSSANMANFVLNGVYLAITVLEGSWLTFHWRKWKKNNPDEFDATAAQGNNCKSCKAFAKMFVLRYDGEEEQTTHDRYDGEDEQRTELIQETYQSSKSTMASHPGNAEEASPNAYAGQSSLQGAETPEFQPVQEEGPSNTTDNEKLGQHVPLASMEFNFIDELANLLDTLSQNGNWESLAYRFGLTRNEVNKIKYNSTAHRNFFVQLAMAKPNITLNEIKRVVEKGIRRKANLKIFQDISKLPAEEKPPFDVGLGSLIDNNQSFMFIQKHVADKLMHTDNSNLLSWKNIASYYGLDEHIKSIEEGGRPQPERPTRLLIESLVGRQEECMVSTLIKHLKEMKRMDVIKKVKEWIEARESGKDHKLKL